MGKWNSDFLITGFADAIPVSGKPRIGHIPCCASYLDVLRTIYSIDDLENII